MISRKRDKQKSKQKLLKAAFDIFVAKGFDGARVDEIAGKAGVNKRMIYDWFGNKEQLYIHVLRTTFEDLFTYPLPESDPGGDPLNNATAIVRWYFDFLSENPGFVRLLEWETLSGGHRAGQVLLDVMGGALQRLQEVIRAGKQQGSFGRTSPCTRSLRCCTTSVSDSFLESSCSRFSGSRTSAPENGKRKCWSIFSRLSSMGWSNRVGENATKSRTAH